ncbi:hypothetical protein C3B59_08265 [Cryobacterium zongtaii]|uniref:HTH marR-type domain-containing protein n=1 Tax=Cryobacterium zongtaii TaxID=1259217 RepID=A0A2S3ZGH8_9MICO|nr:helix-turn-helix domain-containing protein [Cryobacterium zongtaii]POH66409.1 hypothetical protein C3B59_08265 [Cryobacterium zongtaii]
MSDSVDKKSKLLFNNIYVLRVAGAIGASDGEVDSKALQDQLDLGQSAVQRVLKVLEGVGLVERVERTTRTEPLVYQRVSHPFWDAVSELANA